MAKKQKRKATPSLIDPQYIHAAIAVDIVIFGWSESGLEAVLIERKHGSFAGDWALPGGFVQYGESLEEAAKRELKEETNMTAAHLEQLFTWGAPQRDPRGRVISVSYFALVKPEDHSVKADSDAAKAAWFPVANLPELAFDHKEIFDTALKRLQAKIRYQPIGFNLLPAKFTIGQMQRLYEDILLGTVSFDRRNFRKKMLSLGILEEHTEVQAKVPHRAGKLFSFNPVKYKEIAEKGTEFRLWSKDQSSPPTTQHS